MATSTTKSPCFSTLNHLCLTLGSYSASSSYLYQPPTKCHSRKFGSYGPKTLKPVNFGQKWPNFGLKCPKFRHIRTFLAYRIWFSQRKSEEQLSYQKLGRFIAAFGSYNKNSQTCQFRTKWPNFGLIKCPQFCHIRIFLVYTLWFSQKRSEEHAKR